MQMHNTKYAVINCEFKHHEVRHGDVWSELDCEIIELDWEMWCNLLVTVWSDSIPFQGVYQYHKVQDNKCFSHHFAGSKISIMTDALIVYSKVQ